MLRKIKKQIKNSVPEWMLIMYHTLNASMAACVYRFPSRKLIVVGITGTKGKTSTSEFTWSVLQHGGGHTTGLIGTAHIYIGEKELPNTIHMTMPSPWLVQKLLRQMVSSGCTHVVLEVSSEGLKQNRHIGIDYDIGVFTNLSPEHLRSHNNSFEEYRKAKGKLFIALANRTYKKIFPTPTGIYNRDDESFSYYYNFPVPHKLVYSCHELEKSGSLDKVKNEFIFNSTQIHVQLPGYFNLYNALAAATVGHACGLQGEQIKKGIEHVQLIPGRMEQVNLGQPFTVYIDYAHERLSMDNLLKTLLAQKKDTARIILLFGAEGGGRDIQKRKDIGLLAHEMADIVIVTNVDPYDDDPMSIITDIGQYVIGGTKIVDENVFLIEDRRQAINKAFSLARENDIVCICGKGAERSMVIGGIAYPWDEQSIVREILNTYI